MHPRVESLPQPAPDYRRFLAAVRRQGPTRVPSIELAIHPEIVAKLLDDPGLATQSAESPEAARARVRLQHRLGYDVFKVSAVIPFQIDWVAGKDASALSRSARNWQNQHGGPIQTCADCAAYPWPTAADVDFAPVEAAAAALPDGMRLVGFAGGVFEFATYLTGLERFMLAVYDEPELIAQVCERVGRTIYAVFETYAQMDAVGALWLGDDLGSKNGLLVSPDLLQTYIFPWYRRFVELAHRYDKPFLLHSCGKTDTVMPTLVNEVGIDAKHSFEDTIEPVETFVDRWAGKIGVMGGIDVNLLSIGTEDAVRTRVRDVLEHAAPTGAYVCGSGNSIPNYVAPGNFLAMLETVAEFNGRG